GNDRFLGKFLQRFEQKPLGLRKPAVDCPTCGESAMDPTTRPLRRDRDQGPGNLLSGIPTVAFGTNGPTDFEHVRVVQVGRGDSRDLFAGFGVIAQFQPADGRLQMMRVRWFEFLHNVMYATRNASTQSRAASSE